MEVLREWRSVIRLHVYLPYLRFALSDRSIAIRWLQRSKDGSIRFYLSHLEIYTVGIYSLRDCLFDLTTA